MKVIPTTVRWFALIFCVATASTEPIGDFEANNFRYVKDGYEVRGSKAVKKGKRLTITNAKITFRRGDIILITTPSAVLDQAAKRVYGNEKVKIRSSHFILTGEGFDLDIDRQRVVIRKSVHITLFAKIR